MTGAITTPNVRFLGPTATLKAPDLEAAAEERMKAGKGPDDSGGRGKKKTPVGNALKGKRAPAARDKVAKATGVSARTLAKAGQVTRRRAPRGSLLGLGNGDTDNFAFPPVAPPLGSIKQQLGLDERHLPRRCRTALERPAHIAAENGHIGLADRSQVFLHQNGGAGASSTAAADTDAMTFRGRAIWPSSGGSAICGGATSLPHVTQPDRSARANNSR